MYEESIVNVLMDDSVDHLALKMIIEVQDETKVGLVRSGRLQSDPTVYKLNITLHPGGTDNPDCSLPKGYAGIDAAFYMPNGAYWLRKFYAEFEMFFVGETERDEARTKANVVMSRARAAMMGFPLPNYRDAFNEGAILRCFVTKIELSEGGGPGNFIWRGKLHFEFLTDTEVVFEQQS